MIRIFASLGALFLLAASPVFAQDIGQDMGDGDCTYDRQVYRQGAEVCQGGALMQCNAGAWDEIGACPAGPGRAPISGGADEVEGDNEDAD